MTTAKARYDTSPASAKIAAPNDSEASARPSWMSMSIFRFGILSAIAPASGEMNSDGNVAAAVTLPTASGESVVWSTAQLNATT